MRWIGAAQSGVFGSWMVSHAGFFGLDAPPLDATSSMAIPDEAATWWLQACFAAGVIAILCSAVMEFVGGRLAVPALWGAMCLSAAQVIFFASLTLLMAVAAGRIGDPRMMTLGVLLFGTVGCAHVLAVRRLWGVRTLVPDVSFDKREHR